MFSIEYTKKNTTNKVPLEVEENILAELAVEKKLITDSAIPLRSYNYSYIKDKLNLIYGQKVSLPTIISREKAAGYYLKKKDLKVNQNSIVQSHIKSRTLDFILKNRVYLH